MKKVIKLLIKIFILVLIFEFIIYIFKDSHNVEYKIKHNKTEFTVNEVYKKQKYYVLITNKNNKYSFEIDNNFHKKKKIVSDILEYKTKDLSCIYPVVKNSNDTNIICSKNGNTYHYTYYKDILSDFVKRLQEKKYESESWNKKSTYQTKLDTLQIYNKNINEDTYIYIYKYDGFYTINNKNSDRIKLFKNDNYVNTLGFRLNEYYIVPDYDQSHDYKDFYIIDMTNNKIKTNTYKKVEISKDSYINGIIEDEAYIFDKDELKQYKIYKNGKKIKEVGNKEDGVLYYDLEFKNENVYNFRDKEITFKTYKDYIKEIEKETNLKYIRNNNDTYYYQTKDNNVYYYNIHNKQKVLLFNKKITDFILLDDTLYFISGNTLYSYNQNKGLKQLVIYNELEFNYKNRIAIYTE